MNQNRNNSIFLSQICVILFALLLLGEVPSIREIVGAVIIVAVVITAQIM